jgi:hypothetical protein
MTTRSKATKAPAHATVATKSKSTVATKSKPAVAAAPPASAATPATPATPAAPPPPAPPSGFIAPPPPGANIPPVPTGFEPTTGANYRGVQPRTAELVALPLAIANLADFTTYATVMGTSAPPLTEVQQTFEVSNAWAAMRNASSAWDAYSRDQEGVAWTAMRALMARLKPAFDLAVKANPSIGTTYAGLGSLLGARTVIAQKSVATKKKNKQNVAEGKEPTHGEVGKARQKAAAKAALAAQNAKPTAPPSAPVTAPVTAPTPAEPVADAPLPAAPVAQAAIAAPTPANGAPAASGGTPHS